MTDTNETDTTDMNTEETDMATTDTDTTDRTANADGNGGFYTDLAAEATALLNDEDAWTWMDQDPSVAWDDPESGHGRLAAIYERAGWERCYHDRGTVFHFNVKIDCGQAAYHALHDAVNASNLNQPRVLEIAYQMSDGELGDLYFWWQDLGDEPAIFDAVSPDMLEVYSCGRQGGYLQVHRTHLLNADLMMALAQHCTESVAYFSGADYGADLAARAIDDYKDAKLAELASPRIERIEA